MHCLDAAWSGKTAPTTHALYTYDTTTHAHTTHPSHFILITNNSTINLLLLPIAGRQDITSVTIGADIIDIDEGAFNGCVNLRTVKLPCHLESIGAYAFYNCKSLQELYIPGTLRILRVSAFSGCIKLANLRYPPDIKDRLLV